MALPPQPGLLLVLPLIVAAVVGYLLGSVPFAYLMVRWKSRVDIRKSGSGNVGTLNSFMVTKSKWVGIVVLLLDLLKGAAAVTIAPLFGASDPFLAQTVAGAAAVAGHNFPVWLGWKGGRGLATGAGVMLPLSWGSVALWVIAWGVSFAPLRKVNVANALATLLMVILAVVAPGEVIEPLLPAGATITGFRVLVILVMGVIFVRHIAPVREYLRDRKGNKARTSQ